MAARTPTTARPQAIAATRPAARPQTLTIRPQAPSTPNLTVGPTNPLVGRGDNLRLAADTGRSIIALPAPPRPAPRPTTPTSQPRPAFAGTLTPFRTPAEEREAVALFLARNGQGDAALEAAVNTGAPMVDAAGPTTPVTAATIRQKAPTTPAYAEVMANLSEQLLIQDRADTTASANQLQDSITGFIRDQQSYINEFMLENRRAARRALPGNAERSGVVQTGGDVRSSLATRRGRTSLRIDRTSPLAALMI